VSDSGAL